MTEASCCGASGVGEGEQGAHSCYNVGMWLLQYGFTMWLLHSKYRLGHFGDDTWNVGFLEF